MRLLPPGEFFSDQDFLKSLGEFDKAVVYLCRAAATLHDTVTAPAHAHAPVLDDLQEVRPPASAAAAAPRPPPRASVPPPASAAAAPCPLIRICARETRATRPAQF